MARCIASKIEFGIKQSIFIILSAAWGRKISQTLHFKKKLFISVAEVRAKPESLRTRERHRASDSPLAVWYLHSQPAWQIAVWKYQVSSEGSLRAVCLWHYQTKISVYLDTASKSVRTPGFAPSYVNRWLRRGGKGKTGTKKAKPSRTEQIKP